MAGPALPVNIDSTYADSATDASVKLHQQYHDTIHSIVNQFDTGLGTAGVGNVLAWNGSAYAPSSATTAGAIVIPETYGAVGDGATDDQTALNNAIAALKSGDTLRLTGKYKHTGTVTVNKAGVTLDGGGELYGTTQTACALLITANNVTVNDLRVTSTLTVRQTTPNAGGMIVGPTAAVTGFRSKNVRLIGNGIGVLSGSSDFVLDHPTVYNSLADGIHITGGSHHGRLIAPTVVHPGDDGVAVVSYLSDAAACHDIDIIRPHVQNGYNGRGITCVGGYNITFLDIYVSQNSGAGVYIAVEVGSLPTRDVDSVKVIGGRIDHANMLGPSAGSDLGSVLITNQATSVRTVTNVEVSGLVVDDCFGEYFNLGCFGSYAGCINNATFSDIVITGRTPRLIEYDNNATNVNVWNLTIGVTQYQIHPSENYTTPNGNLYGSQGSTAVMSNGTFWMQVTTGGEGTGWVQLGTATDTKQPAIPTGLTATAGTGQVSLSWTATTDNVTAAGSLRYYVYRTVNNTTRMGKLIANRTAGSTTYTDTGLTAGTKYYYAVSSIDAAGNESYMSAIVSATAN